MPLSQSQKTARSPELIWKEIMELVGQTLEANPIRTQGEMEMRAAGDPSMLLAKLHQMEPSKAVQLLREKNMELALALRNPHEATPPQKKQIVSAVLDLFSAT